MNCYEVAEVFLSSELLVVITGLHLVSIIMIARS